MTTHTGPEGDEFGAPKIVDRRTFQAELDALRLREKAHMREGDAIAAGGSPWSKSTAPHHSSANVVMSHYWMSLRGVGCS